MNVNVSIMLNPEEFAADLAGNATQLAEQILTVVGGDAATDTCHVSIADYGTAGPMPIPPPDVIPPETMPITVNSTFSTQNTSPPGDKQTRTNAAAAADVTAVYIDNESTEGDDLSVKLLALTVGDTIEIRGVADTARFAIFTLTALPVNQSGFVELTVAYTEMGTNLTNSACTLKFAVRA